MGRSPWKEQSWIPLVVCSGIYIINDRSPCSFGDAFMNNKLITVSFKYRVSTFIGPGFNYWFSFEAQCSTKFKYTLNLLGSGPLKEKGVKCLLIAKSMSSKLVSKGLIIMRKRRFSDGKIRVSLSTSGQTVISNPAITFQEIDGKGHRGMRPIGGLHQPRHPFKLYMKLRVIYESREAKSV